MIRTNFYLDEHKNDADRVSRVHSLNIEQIACWVKRVFKYPEESATTSITAHSISLAGSESGVLIHIDRKDPEEELSRSFCLLADGSCIEIYSSWVSRVVHMTYRLLYILLSPEITYLEGWSRTDDQSSEGYTHPDSGWLTGMRKSPIDVVTTIPDRQAVVERYRALIQMRKWEK